MKKIQKGFTLIELMIVVAIIAILAAIAIPQYQDYVSRTRAAGAITELAGYRSAVASCISETQALTNCSAGSNGIPGIAATTDFPATRNVASIQSITAGVIDATTGATSGGGTSTALLYTGTPTLTTAAINWVTTGTICNATRGLKPGQGGCAP